MVHPDDLKLFREIDSIRDLAANGLIEVHYQPIVDVQLGRGVRVRGAGSVALSELERTRSTCSQAALETE